jgi:cobalt-zinc-cadmium resistance protein CzcA
VAQIREVEGPAVVSRANVQRRQTISVNVRGRDIASFVSEAKQNLRERVSIPPGYFVYWGGQFENLREAVGRLAIAGPAALLLIFMLLYLTYGALRPTLIVYLNVPVAATGGIGALAVRGMDFSISAGVGFIALFGIAVLNGVVLVSTIRDLQSRGAALAEASVAAAKLRLRPVLMTALTDACGFLPMAIASSAGAEVQRPLATVVIGGLVTSTLLTLFVLPTVYARLGGDVAKPA